MKILQFILVFVLALLSVYAVAPVQDFYFQFDTIDGSLNAANSSATEGTHDFRGSYTSNPAELLNNSMNMSGNYMSDVTWINHAASTSFTYCYWMLPADDTTFRYMLSTFSGSFPQFEINTNFGNDIDWIIRDSTGATLYRSGSFDDIIPGEWSHQCFVNDFAESRMQIYVNGQIRTNGTNFTGNNIDLSIVNMTMGARITGGNNLVGDAIDNLKIWTSTALNGQQVKDEFDFGAQFLVLAPSIVQSSYNHTTGRGLGNQTIWRNNTNFNSQTFDSTPTVSFTLNGAGNCSIGLDDVNYTTMVAADVNTTCGTTDTTSHTCTLPASKKLSVGNQNMYISCIINAGTEDMSSSTSGALNITLDTIEIDQSTYNVTNAFSNATEWRTDTGTPVQMRVSQPIVVFDTFIAGNCSIGNTNLNYTAMTTADSTTDCGGSDNIAHSCTLPVSQSLPVGPSLIYISCIGVEGESVNSLSGPLNITRDRTLNGQVFIVENTTQNKTFGGSDIRLFDPTTNTTIDTTVANGTGHYTVFPTQAGTYTICSHINNSVRDVCANDVVVA